jgi:CPA2 family monovalent cation:H+ antiporter-2
LVELGAILFALGILGRRARRLRLPVGPLYLLARLAFGQGGLLSLSASEEFISVAANIGVILLPSSQPATLLPAAVESPIADDGERWSR